MGAAVFLFHRRRQHAELDIVVDHGGGQPLAVRIRVGGEKALRQQQHLIHVQLQIRQLFPAGQQVRVLIHLRHENTVLSTQQ